VRNDGSLSGYRWGVERKRALIDGKRSPGRAFSSEADTGSREENAPKQKPGAPA
jgi:hypothetical protein